MMNRRQSWTKAAPTTSRREKFATSRSKSESSMSDEVSSDSMDDLKAQLAKWKSEKGAADKAQAKKQARREYEQAILGAQYCDLGTTECNLAAKRFCQTHKLDKPDTVELNKFLRYAKEKGLVKQGQDVTTLCQTWASHK